MRTSSLLACCFLAGACGGGAVAETRAETSTESLLHEAETRLRAIYDRGEFRAGGFRADWLPDSTGRSRIGDSVLTRSGNLPGRSPQGRLANGPSTHKSTLAISLAQDRAGIPFVEIRRVAAAEPSRGFQPTDAKRGNWIKSRSDDGTFSLCRGQLLGHRHGRQTSLANDGQSMSIDNLDASTSPNSACATNRGTSGCIEASVLWRAGWSGCSVHIEISASPVDNTQMHSDNTL